MPREDGANGITEQEFEELFKSLDDQQATPPATDDGTTTKTPAQEVDTTKAFAHRLKESTDKARAEERENIAKAMGFTSYDELIKSRERNAIVEKGLDPDQVAPVVEEIVKKRMEEDPRLKELDELRKQKIEEFGKKELQEINALTGGEITSLTQLSPEVIDLWKKKGSLKSAYIELEGEKLIAKIRGEQSKGSTAHLNTPTGSSVAENNKRPLTPEEKKVWKQFYPAMTEEELDKKMVDK